MLFHSNLSYPAVAGTITGLAMLLFKRINAPMLSVVHYNNTALQQQVAYSLVLRKMFMRENTFELATCDTS